MVVSSAVLFAIQGPAAPASRGPVVGCVDLFSRGQFPFAGRDPLVVWSGSGLVGVGRVGSESGSGSGVTLRFMSGY